MTYECKWLTPRQAFEHVLEYVRHIYDAQWQLFEAVHDGAVRVRYHERELTGEERYLLLRKRHGDLNDPFALPCDIELSLEDLRRWWNDETHPLRKRRGPKAGTVGFAAKD